MNNITVQIKNLRKSKNLTQFKLGILSGFKACEISLIESSKRNVTLKNLIKIADALNARIELIPNDKDAA